MKPKSEAYYRLDLLNPYITRLLETKETGTVIGFPCSGVNHLISKSIASLSLDDSFAVIDISICPRNTLDFIKQVGDLIRSHVQNGIKIIQINRLNLARKSGLRQLKALNSIRNELRRQFIYIFHLNDLPSLINPQINRAEYGISINSNLLYYPFASTEEWQTLLDTIEPKYKHTLNAEQSELVYHLSGGCPHLTQALVKKLAAGQVVGLDDSTIEIGKMAFAHMSRRQTQSLRNLSQASPIQIDSFRKLGLIDSQNQIKSQILQKVIEGASLSSTLTINSSDSIVLNEEIIDSQLSPSEFSIIKFMITQGSITRSEIANICYGQNHSDTYSDYSIDKIISRLRQRLIQLGASRDLIVTLRGRGYKIKSS